MFVGDYYLIKERLVFSGLGLNAHVAFSNDCNQITQHDWQLFSLMSGQNEQFINDEPSSDGF